MIDMTLVKYVPEYQFNDNNVFTPDKYSLSAYMLGEYTAYLVGFTEGNNTSVRLCSIDKYLELKKKFEEKGEEV
jgi:hypothetical protein